MEECKNKDFPKGLRTIQDRERWEEKSGWQVTLSDGTTVYQNDEEIGEPAWVVLRNYLAKTPTLSIAKLSFGFRDNTRSLPENAEGYYFRNSCIGSFSGSKSSFIIGHLENGVCKVEKYEIPEMTYMWSEDRPVSEAGESLIVNRPMVKSVKTLCAIHELELKEMHNA